MNIDLIKVLPHNFSESAFSEKLVAFSSAKKIYLYELANEKELILMDQISVKNTDVLEFNNNGNLLYILDTSGNFYVYNIKSKTLINLYTSDRGFGCIYVADNDDCLWCSSNLLYKYSNKEKRTISISLSPYTLTSIIKSTTEFIYLSAFISDIFYVLKVSLVDMNIVDNVKIKGFHKISKVWYAQASDNIFIVKRNQLLCLEVTEDINHGSCNLKTVCKLKDQKNMIFLKESNNGNLIAFSHYKSLIVFNIDRKNSTVLTQISNKSKMYIGNICFLLNDKYMAISYDNFDYSGKTCFYKCI